MNVGAWPLIGRAEELDAIAEAVADPEAAGVILAGAAGVGKTRLLREALVAAEARGHQTEWVSGFAASTEIPLAPFAHLLPAPAGPSPDRLELLRRSIAALTERSPDGRLVLGVDDAHLLDEVSA